MDIRDAILQLLNVIREGNKKLIQHDKSEGEISNQVLKKLNTISSTEAVEKKIDNISTFLLRLVILQRFGYITTFWLYYNILVT